jgi:predicted CXXCH cytochrome family protein
MKYSKIVSMGLLLLLAGAFVICMPGGTARAAITGTAHDLSGAGYGTTQICIFCHTPHNASTTLTAPLWNHAATAATFTLYASPTLNATVEQPGAVSKACLSCHDGTVAVDTYGTTTGTHTMTGSAMVGTDLSNDHPVGFTYDAALATADGGLVTPNSASGVDAARTVPLFAAKLECGSCHNVHDDTHSPFLRKTNAASALCLSCHSK